MDSRPVREFAERLDEAQSFHFPNKADSISTLFAAETIKVLAVPADVEGWSLLVMEWAERNVAAVSGRPQLQKRSHDLDDIGRRQDLSDDFSRVFSQWKPVTC